MPLRHPGDMTLHSLGFLNYLFIDQHEDENNQLIADYSGRCCAENGRVVPNTPATDGAQAVPKRITQAADKHFMQMKVDA